MITRIHGASSTLAANPPRKHRRAKRKNPMHAKKRRRNPELTQAEKIAKAKEALKAAAAKVEEVTV